MPPGYIDGAKAPQLIPDNTAFRLVFLSLRVPKSPTPEDRKKQSSHFKRIGLSDVDTVTAQNIIAQFDTAYDGWQTKYLQTSIAFDEAVATSDREAIVAETHTSLMKQLSPEGAAKLAQFVEAAKVRMVVRE